MSRDMGWLRDSDVCGQLRLLCLLYVRCAYTVRESAENLYESIKFALLD